MQNNEYLCQTNEGIMAKEKKTLTLTIDLDIYKQIEAMGEGSGMTAGVINMFNRYDKITKAVYLEIRQKLTSEQMKEIVKQVKNWRVDDYTRYNVEYFASKMEDAGLNIEALKTLTPCQLSILFDIVRQK